MLSEYLHVNTRHDRKETSLMTNKRAFRTFLASQAFLLFQSCSSALKRTILQGERCFAMLVQVYFVLKPGWENALGLLHVEY